MIGFILVSVIGIFIAVRPFWPLPNLKYIDYEEYLRQHRDFRQYKVIDIRDATDYLDNPTPDTINISVGRLAFTWEKYLHREDNVIIMSPGILQSKKAARILRKRGFKYLYVMKYKVDVIS
ncbi:rhodanese-like domain-containing protein [Paenibacillus sp. 1781tsa1]|uniref:rhodanese-like domain-containing protein n=1 Tax=Paenibacillus sp. 1781tsa1 TaxID=2953810 RepID=UPI0020A16D0A|nr:rhodanese-like domain-containing protein [Paenibacillus sp. 1781tsa1]MCP1184215.1 rhodanese-like domain-containing protein [Paenibacillus sp. 1781tsa1]